MLSMNQRYHADFKVYKNNNTFVQSGSSSPI